MTTRTSSFSPRLLALFLLLTILMGIVFYIAPLVVLRSAGFEGFSAEQLHSIALVLLKVNDQGAGAAMAFFGFSSVLGGYLIFRSTFLPRWLGALSFVAGLGWLTFLYRPLGDLAFPIAALLGLGGAVATIFWFMVFGVNEERWTQRSASPVPV